MTLARNPASATSYCPMFPFEVDCLRGKDERAFPYLWNVPVIRMDDDHVDNAIMLVMKGLRRIRRSAGY